MLPLNVQHSESSTILSRGDDPGLEISSFAQGGGKVRCPNINTKVALASERSFLEAASEHRDRKIEHESHDDCDWQVPSLPWIYVEGHDDWGRHSEWDRVITRTF